MGNQPQTQIMTTMINELYDALRKAGVDEDTARKAAQAVLGAEDKDKLVTKDHLQAQLAEVKGEIRLIKWMLGFNLAVSTAVLFKLLV